MSAIPSILQKIIEAKQEDVIARRVGLGEKELRAKIRDCEPTRGFARAIRIAAAAGSAVIAEIKRASPSSGVIRPDFRPAQIARSYERGGATCLSVLTEVPNFQGADEYLVAARESVDLPVLRKDFVIDPWQILESRLMGADCILLIVAVLGRDKTGHFVELAAEAGLDAIAEVHNEEELEIALEASGTMIGVNNRDLHTFRTDLATTERLRPLIPRDRCMITESGVHSREDVERLRNCGVDAFLVGEAFMRAKDPGEALKGLFL